MAEQHSLDTSVVIMMTMMDTPEMSSSPRRVEQHVEQIGMRGDVNSANGWYNNTVRYNTSISSTSDHDDNRCIVLFICLLILLFLVFIFFILGCHSTISKYNWQCGI